MWHSTSQNTYFILTDAHILKLYCDAPFKSSGIMSTSHAFRPMKVQMWKLNLQDMLDMHNKYEQPTIQHNVCNIIVSCKSSA